MCYANKVTETALFCLQRPSVFKPMKTFDEVGNVPSQSSGGVCVMRIDPRQMRLYLQFVANENHAMRDRSTACSICQTVPECRSVKRGKIFSVSVEQSTLRCTAYFSFMIGPSALILKFWLLIFVYS